MDHDLARLESKVDRLDEKLDQVLVWVPTVVTWGRLGGAVLALATLTVAVVTLVL